MIPRSLRDALVRLRKRRQRREFFDEWDRQGWDVPLVDDPYRLCPRCEQGAIGRMRVRSTGEVVRVCDECDATWGEPSSERSQDLRSYLRERGLTGDWDQLTEVR